MLAFNFKGMVDTLPIMAKGLFGIFFVTAIIILCIVLLNVLTSGKKKKDSKDN